MPNQRDFYAANAVRTSQDIVRLSQRRDIDTWTKIKLAAGGYSDDFLKGAARELYLQLAHNARDDSLFKQRITNIFQKLAEPMLSDLTDFIDLTPWKSLRLPFFLIEFYFELSSPLITRDESSHYPIENPVRKDYALKLPILGSTGWKGLLRNAFLFAQLLPSWKNFETKKDEDSKNDYLATRWQMLRLFGSEKEASNDQDPHASLKEATGGFKQFATDKFKQEGQEPPKEVPNFVGCMYTYPTLFSNLEIELINPHDSVRRVGTQPIHLEIVPARSTGLFRLFYLLNKPATVMGENLNATAQKDLGSILQALQFLFLEFGISAKRTSGHGQVKKELANKNGNSGRIVDNFLLTLLGDGTRQLQQKQIKNLNDLESVLSGGGINHE